jgi:hypothetical protein
LRARVTRAASRQLGALASAFVANGFSRHAPRLAIGLALALGGCSGSHVIDQYAADYRVTVATAGDAQLLLNILRAKDNMPIHFYDLSNIHGAIQLTAGTSASIPFTNTSLTSGTISPAIAAQNSPTFDLGTTDTQDFTRGILSKLDPLVVKTLFDQGVDPRIMMLLFFSRYTAPNGRVFLNTTACDPTRPVSPAHENRCYNQIYDYLGEVEGLLAHANFAAGVGPDLKAKLQANAYFALRPIGGSLEGAWSLKDNLDQLRQLDGAKYKLIGKQLYEVSGQLLAVCYEDAQKKLHSLIPRQYPDAACTQNEIIDRRPLTQRNAGLSLRSTYDIIQFLGQVLRFQQEYGEGRCLTLESTKRDCDTDEVLFQVNAPAGTPVIATKYGDAWYAIYDRACDKLHRQPCDYSPQIIAILELLINENKAAKDIIATPRVQFVP